MIDWLYINITIEEVDIRSIMKIVETKIFNIKILVVHEVDGQLALVAGFDNKLDWVDGVTEIINRVDIYRVIDFSWRGTFNTE